MPFALGILFTAFTMPTVLTVDLTVVNHIEEAKTEWMQELHNCENINNVPRILDTNGKYSYADFMYQMDTWLKYGKKFGATRNNISSSTLQWKVTRYVLDTYGWENDWVICGKRVVSQLGDYPDS